MNNERSQRKQRWSRTEGTLLLVGGIALIPFGFWGFGAAFAAIGLVDLYQSKNTGTDA